MGAKVSIMAAKRRKRITNSSKSTISKTHSQNSSNLNTPPNYIIDEKTHVNNEQNSHASSVIESMLSSGRTFHHEANSAYWFPNDDEEMDRLIGVSVDINQVNHGTNYYNSNTLH